MDLANCFSPLYTEETKEMFDKISESNKVFNAENNTKLDDRLPMEAIVVVFDRSSSMTEKCFSKNKHALTRLEVIKECWHAFINRSTAYDFPNEIGLILFDTIVEKACDITSSYEKFLRKVETIETTGTTALRDAIEEAVQLLIKWKNNKVKKRQRKDTKLRIIALTDGLDNESSINENDVAKLLNKHNIILDAISIGSHNKSLHAMAKATGGYIFVPKTFIDTIRIFELESFLSISQRKTIRNHEKLGLKADQCKFDHLKRTQHDICTFDIAPKGKMEPNLICKNNTKSLQYIMDEIGFDTTNSTISKKQRFRRVMQEMNGILRKPHPCFDVYPCESDIYFWKVILECPVENHSSAYEGGVWLLYVSFPDDYPSKAPIMRFVTPIKHVNVNCYGRICHSIFSTNYTRDVTIKNIFSNVYGLMLHPDFDNPLDNVLRTEYGDDRQKFFLSVEKHTDKHAKKPHAMSRQQWMKQLADGTMLQFDNDAKDYDEEKNNDDNDIEQSNNSKQQLKSIEINPAYNGWKTTIHLQKYEFTIDILKSKLLSTFKSKGLKGTFQLKTDGGYVIKKDSDITTYLPYAERLYIVRMKY
eukprot:162641_1